MLKELIEKYNQYSDVELMNVYHTKDGYTDEAKKALEIVIEEKGGIESLKKRYNNLVETKEEKQKIKEEIIILHQKKLKKEEIFQNLSSNKLTKLEIIPNNSMPKKFYHKIFLHNSVHFIS